MVGIEELVNLSRKKFAVPNLIISAGILYLLAKMLSIWFGFYKEPEVKLADIDPALEKAFLLNKNISLSDYEIIPGKNLFRPSRSEWIPPVVEKSTETVPIKIVSLPPPLNKFTLPSLPSYSKQPTSPPALKSPPLPSPALPISLPSPAKPTPSPEIKISGILGGGISSNRAIIEGIYFTPVDFTKTVIKKKGYKLYDMIGQYRISAIDGDKVTLTDPNGKSYEFYMDENKAKREQMMNELIDINELLFPPVPGIVKPDYHISGAATSDLHISGGTASNAHISGMASPTPHDSGTLTSDSHISGVETSKPSRDSSGN